MRGAEAEAAAERLLSAQGLRTLARNYRCRGGELDLVMLDGKTLVVVEVRARGSSRFASAAESIDRRKQARVILATQLFLASEPKYAAHALRFDVVLFDGAGPGEWIRSAFDAS
ncbi:MAG: YraN family protein [Pseudomonadota bacterium]|nr:YraN family protein [Pseudomonadota bacterium]